jgi:hypothetical protein
MLVRTLAALGVTVTLLALSAPADPPAAPPDKPADPKELTNEALLKNKALAEQYQEFEAALQRLAQRMERSPKEEDRQKAQSLLAALKIAASDGDDKKSVEKRFKTLIEGLAKAKVAGITEQDANDAILESDKLAETLDRMIAFLMTEDDSARRKEEIKSLQQVLKELDKVLFAQKQERARTEAGRDPGKKLAQGQNEVTKKTEKLSDMMAKRDANKPGEPKPGEQKPGQQKPGEQKPGEPKPNQSKPGEPKPGEQKPGEPKPGEPKEGDPNQSPGDPKQQSPKPPTPGQEQVKRAIKKQKDAEQNLEKNEKKEGSKDQDKAVQELEQARKELEKRLKQLRDEEQLEQLKRLEARCAEMLKLQTEVYEETVRINESVLTQAQRKPSNAEVQRSQEQADKEARLVGMAKDALALLSEEGTAVAFGLSFETLRDDMTTVKERLERCDVAEFTQNIEKDIIAQLKDAIEALKKKQQDIKNNKSPPPPNQGPPPPQRLLDLLAELKLIRSMQIRVNQRTLDYAKQYQGEQADDPNIRSELQKLAVRQFKIEESLRNIATGKNQ